MKRKKNPPSETNCNATLTMILPSYGFLTITTVGLQTNIAWSVNSIGVTLGKNILNADHVTWEIDPDL